MVDCDACERPRQGRSSGAGVDQPGFAGVAGTIPGFEWRRPPANRAATGYRLGAEPVVNRGWGGRDEHASATMAGPHGLLESDGVEGHALVREGGEMGVDPMG